MDKKSNNVVKNFFDTDSIDYFKNKYKRIDRTFMNVRHYNILQFLEAANLPKNSLILDAGCGPGLMIYLFHQY